jgi:aflatoxin B1 aldehyde reductase
VNELYQAGYFQRFGISCYTAWEVAQICELCARHGWKAPDVYSGLYNALQRAVEPELFPCLRHYGIAFYMFRPLGKGLLTDRAQRSTAKREEGGKSVQERQESSDAEFDALDVIRPVAQKLGLTTAEAAMRWGSHHSLLKSELGDAVITGASSAAQLAENLANAEKGPLPAEMVAALDEGWALVKATATPYYL